MPARIAVIGSINVDLITYLQRIPLAGETIEAAGFAMHHGGKGANQAVAAAKVGGEVLMLGKVGDDIFGENAFRNLQAHGVGTDHVARVHGVPTGLATILVEPSGENRIMIVGGANGRVRPEDIDRAAEDLARCELILLQHEIPLETVYHAIAFAAAHGKEVLLNPAPAKPELDLQRLHAVTFLVPNQTELAQLSGLPAETMEQAASAARRLIAAGIRAVIVTMGADGALLVTRDDTRPIAPVSVRPVDTTGAGDAFIGSFAHFYVGTRDVARALRQAVRYAAHSVTRRGTQSSFADAEEFREFCRRVDGQAAA